MTWGLAKLYYFHFYLGKQDDALVNMILQKRGCDQGSPSYVHRTTLYFLSDDHHQVTLNMFLSR